MIDFTDGKLDEIKAFALKTGQMDQLNSVLKRLTDRESETTSVEVYTDFAPYSLYFVEKVSGEFRSNGGVIYHGPHDGFGSGSAPSFSVCLTPSQGWSIHT